MKLDIQTIAFVSCLTFIAQALVLLVQYSVNKSYKGIGWWLLGSSCMALGVIFMPLVAVKSLELFARIANPLVVLGQIFLYVGVLRFLDCKENKWLLALIYGAFLLSYYFFMFVRNDISSRSIFLTAVTALLSFMTASRLYFSQDRFLSASANFTVFVFFAFGLFNAARSVYLLIAPPMQAYSDQALILVVSFIVPIISSLLWTFGFIIMVNQRLNEENREEKEKLQLIFNASPDAAVISRLDDGNIVDVNAGFLRMSGYSRAELIDHSTILINIWQNPQDRESFVGEIKEKGICENREFVFRRKDGSLLTGSISAKILTFLKVDHIISVINDITRSRLIEEYMRESEALYRSILDASPDDITITDLKGTILMISPAAKKLFGYEPEYDQFVGTQLLDYVIAEDRERALANIICMTNGQRIGPNEYQGIRKDGSLLDVEVNSSLILGANNQPAKMVFVVRDISERKRTEQQIQQLVQQLEIEKKTAQLNAITDSLTGLANRRYFDEVLSIEINRMNRSGQPMSLIMMDVDHFKLFNDSYGHIAGDNCLRQIGATLDTIFGRSTDIVARYGGEEFVGILTETDLAGAEILAERIRKAVEQLAIPHCASEVSDFVTISLGVVTVGAGLRAISPEQVIALADEALYRAKNGGRNQAVLATGELDRQ